ncbi:MAG: hypothetical protein OEW77_07280, partial [Gemmatimonadota bacterium]|nr:hypothetical protein [Gemmatimonadota bacterium]
KALVLEAWEHNLPTATGPLAAEDLTLLGRFRSAHDAAFDGMASLFVQHQLAPFNARVQAMCENGLDPSHTWFVDIPYSTNEDVQARLYSSPVPAAHCARRHCDPFVCYSGEQRARVDEILRRMAGEGTDAPVLVIDDGAYILQALVDAQPDVRERFRHARVVEQTTRGHRFLESATGHQVIQELGIAAVTVARSATKTRFEAPAIGAAVASAIRNAVKGRRDAVPREGPLRVLVIGYGSVGEASALAVRRFDGETAIDVVETDRYKREEAARQGFGTLGVVPGSVVPGRESSFRYDWVIGCTGGTSFTKEHLGILADGAFLVSGSSAAVEFDRASLVEQADRDGTDDFWIVNDRSKDATNIRTDIAFQLHEKRFTILHAGFPVNFNGEPEHIPTSLIAPTHCLLYAAARQAVAHDTPGLRLLEPAVDHWILEKSLEHLRSVMCAAPRM